MHFKDGDLILGLHDLDHVLGDPTQLGEHLQTEYFKGGTGSDAFLEILDQSGELWMNGITDPSNEDMPIRQQLESIGVQRIVIRLEQVMAGPVDLTIQP
jgi:hypothetical protein